MARTAKPTTAASEAEPPHDPVTGEVTDDPGEDAPEAPEIDKSDTAIPPPAERPARVAIDWAASKITAGLVAAIARAQADIRTVGKGSRNDQGAGGKGYDYASADDMIRECRRAFSRQDVALVTGHYMVDPPDVEPLRDREGNITQWLTATLKLELAAMHVNPKTGEVGVLVVRGEADAIGSRGRPNDKAQRAAETYALGFLARGVGFMDRGSTPKDEDRDQDTDEGAGGGRRRGYQPRQDPKPAASSSGPKVDPLQGLRDSIKTRYHELGGTGWRGWSLVCQDAKLPGPVRVDGSPADVLRKLHDVLDVERERRAATEAQDQAAEGASQREPGED